MAAGVSMLHVNSAVCMRHFKAEEILINKKRIRLAGGAVPSLQVIVKGCCGRSSFLALHKTSKMLVVVMNK